MGAAIFCDVQLEIVLRRKTGAAKHENMREVFPPGAPGIAHVHESRRAGPGVFSRLPGSPAPPGLSDVPSRGADRTVEEA